MITLMHIEMDRLDAHYNIEQRRRGTLRGEGVVKMLKEASHLGEGVNLTPVLKFWKKNNQKFEIMKMHVTSKAPAEIYFKKFG